MLVLLLAFGLSNWNTEHLGQPKISMIQDGNILLYSENNMVALLQANDGEVVWRQRIEKIKAVDMNEAVLAVSNHYFFVLDNETGIVLKQYPHNVKSVIGAAYYNGLVAIRGNKQLTLFNGTEIIWSVQFESEDKIIQFSTDGEFLLASNTKFSAIDGQIIGNQEPAKRVEPQFKYHPTVLEYFEDEKLVWRKDEPYYGSKLLTSVDSDVVMLSNATHLLLLNLKDDKLILVKPAVILGFNRQSKRIILYTPDGFLTLDSKSKEIEEFKGKVQKTIIANSSVINGQTIFAFPSYCKVACSTEVHSSTPSSFVVADCGDSIASALVDTKGKIKYHNIINNAKFGICWSSGDSASLSYVKDKKTPFVSSFSASTNSQRTFETDSLVIAIGHSTIALANGQLLSIHPEGLSATVPFGDAPAPSLFGIGGAGPAVYMPHFQGSRNDGSYNKIKSIADQNGRVVLQGDDIVLVGEQKDGIMLHLIIVAVFALMVLWVTYDHYTSKQSSFWK